LCNVCDETVTDNKSKPEDYNALAHVAETCKLWDLLVGEVPRFPLIFYPDVASGEFILTWIPEYLNGNPLRDPKTIDEFAKASRQAITAFRYQGKA
jgi:hypothetical protein